MKNFLIIAIIIVLGLAVAGYFYWMEMSKTPEEKAAESLERVLESIGQSAELPDLEIVDESIGENIVDVNPINKANPFKDTYKNPFE